MSTAAWLEGADLDLAEAKEHYRELRRALRDENFRRPLAKLLNEGDRLRGSTSTRVERARKRTDTLVVKAVDRLWDACGREREAAMAVAYRLGLKRGVRFDGDERKFLEELSRPVPPRPLVQRDWTAWRDFWRRVVTLRTPVLLGLAAVLLLPLSFSLGGVMGPWLVLGTSGVALSLAIAFKDPHIEPPRVQIAAPAQPPEPEEPETASETAGDYHEMAYVLVVPLAVLLSIGQGGSVIGLLVGLMELFFR